MIHPGWSFISSTFLSVTISVTMASAAWRVPVGIVTVCGALLLIIHLRDIDVFSRVASSDGTISDHFRATHEHVALAMVKGRDIRISIVSPLLQILVGISAFLSSLIAADRLFHFYIALYWKLSGRKPEEQFVASPLPDIADADKYPKVVIQIPMFNEKEVRYAMLSEVHWQLTTQSDNAMQCLAPAPSSSRFQNIVTAQAVAGLWASHWSCMRFNLAA